MIANTNTHTKCRQTNKKKTENNNNSLVNVYEFQAQNGKSDLKVSVILVFIYKNT